MRDDDTSRCQHILDHAQAEQKPEIEPCGMGNRLRQIPHRRCQVDVTVPLRGLLNHRVRFPACFSVNLQQIPNRPGRGIDTGLVKHALERCVQAAALIGGRALMVNAVDKEAAEFWQRRGFAPSKDDPLILFRSIANIAASLALAKHGQRLPSFG